MKLINRNTDYAIRALVYIGGENQRLVSVLEIANKLEIPHPFLRRILQMLQKSHLVESHKGRDGGFRLARPLDKILLEDVIKTFQGSVELVECLFKKRLCDDMKTCVLRKKIKDLEKAVLSELRSITIASLTA